METKTVGQIINEHRKKKSLTQKALADQLNVTDKAVSKWERDIARPDINTVPKLAEILDIPIEQLINIPIKSKVDLEVNYADDTTVEFPADVEDTEWNFECEEYKRKIWKLLLKGILGFGMGVVFALITSPGEGVSSLGVVFLMGLHFAGIPCGWEWLNKILGNWYVVGSIPVVIIGFVIKLIGAMLVGWIAYPVALVYNLVKVQRKGKKIKTIVYAAIIFGIFLVIYFCVLIGTTGSIISQFGSDYNTEQKYSNGDLLTDASQLNETNDVYIAVCKSALTKSLAEEKEAEENGGEILTSSEIKAVYFVSIKETGERHYDFDDNVRMSNAVVVVTSYEVNIANTVKRSEYTVWYYPNFVVNSSGMLEYDTEAEYEDYLSGEKLEDIYMWICTEFDDMSIVALNNPS